MPRRALAPGRTLALALALALAAGSRAVAADEHLAYRWRLQGFVGLLASLFMPTGGEGSLSLVRLPSGNLESELLITSPQSDDGEYFRYGAELDALGDATLRAWSSYRWRGESKSRESKLETGDVMSIASAIYRLRQAPPDKPSPLEIWSDGKTYPVLVVPIGREELKIAGRKVTARHLAIRGVERPGRRFWKGSLELWLGEDPAATPVQIQVERSAARVRLELVTLPTLRALP
ncbi:MAG: DUF3108 domain-containing protein [Thermoanaerobaculia bacterium]